MMDVALINDGPVGVSFTCVDDGVVTLEINTDPPPMDLPSEPMSTSFRGDMSLDDLMNDVQKLSTSHEFVLPKELLE